MLKLGSGPQTGENGEAARRERAGVVRPRRNRRSRSAARPALGLCVARSGLRAALDSRRDMSVAKRPIHSVFLVFIEVQAMPTIARSGLSWRAGSIGSSGVYSCVHSRARRLLLCLFVKGTRPRDRNSALSRCLASASCARTHSSQAKRPLRVRVYLGVRVRRTGKSRFVSESPRASSPGACTSSYPRFVEGCTCIFSACGAPKFLCDLRGPLRRSHGMAWRASSPMRSAAPKNGGP